MENWKQILGLDVVDTSIIHLISDQGRVLTIKDGDAVFRLGGVDANGYLIITFGHSHRKYIHGLVGEYFCEKYEDSECLNHLNGIKTDNRAVNLKWCTYAENNLHAYQLGLKKCNDKRSVPVEIVYEIYKYKKQGLFVRDIQKLLPEKYRSIIKDIFKGKNWKYEYQKYFNESYQKLGRTTHGNFAWNAIPESKVLMIYDLKKTGKSIADISKELNLNYGTTKGIYHGKNWKHLYKQHFS